MNKVLATSVALAVMLGIAPYGAPDASAAEVEAGQTQAAASYSYQAYQQEALKYLNDMRVKSGLSPLVMNPYLTKAAENHVKYLTLNEEWGHSEEKGLSGFTGATPQDRARAVGLSAEMSKYVSETVSFKDGMKRSLESLFSSIYHRDYLLARTNTDVGFGLTDYAFSPMMGYNESNYDFNNSLVVYPYSGQTGVPIGFYGFETPNPLAPFGLKKAGYGLSVSSPSELDKNSVSVVLKDSKGNLVPVTLNFSYANRNMHIFPKYELSYEETYTASVSFANKEGSQSKTWSFTTQNKPTDLSLYESNEHRLAVNGKFTSANIYIPDEAYSHQYAPIVHKNTVYLPAKYLFERLNLDVAYDSKTKKYTFKAKNHLIVWQDGSQYALINKKNVKLTQKPAIFHGDLYLPASFVTTTTGAKVKLMSNRKTVYVDTKVYEPQVLVTKAKQ